MRWTDDPTAYAFAANLPLSKPQACDLPLTDIQALIDANIIAPIERHKVKATGILFSVPEYAKNRRRMIFWPKSINREFQRMGIDAFTFDLGDPMEHLQDVHRGDYAAAMDLACAFFQHELHVDIQPFFCFEFDGNMYAFQRLPMGFCGSCDTQQAFTIAVSPTRDEVTRRTYVDGTRWVGTKTHVSECLTRSREECEAASAQAQFQEPSTVHEWLGVVYDFSQKTVSLSEKMVAKLTRARDNIGNWSLRDMMQAFAYLFYASPVLQLKLASFYHCIKFYSRRCRTLEAGAKKLDDTAQVWPSITRELLTWFNMAIANVPTTPPKPEDVEKANLTLFTDACDDGWGAVLINEYGQCFSVGQKFANAKKLHINVKELLAVSNAAKELNHIIQGRPVRLFIDNTTAIATVKRGYGRSFALNVAERVLQHVGIAFQSVDYVKSADNPSDAPSRGRSLDQHLVARVVQQLASAQGGGLESRRRSARVERLGTHLPHPASLVDDTTPHVCDGMSPLG